MWDYQNDASVSEAINSKDIPKLRSMVNSQLMDDPADSYGLAVKSLAYIRSAVPDIMATHDEDWGEIVSDKSAWTVEYRDLMAGALMKNFSKKRFDHVVEVGKQVFPKRLERPRATGSSSNKKTAPSDKSKILLGAAGVGLVLGLFILKRSTPVGVILTIASAACGIYALIKRKNHEWIT